MNEGLNRRPDRRYGCAEALEHDLDDPGDGKD